jgi:5-enolpyruvylshikimate-3-phosphate synthase
MNVAVNEYNDTIIKVLIDNGVNIQFKNQRISNGIKVSNIIVKQSQLKPAYISKLRLKNIMPHYIFVVLLNVLKNNSLTLMGIDLIKKEDAENYEFMCKFLETLGYMVDENKGNLEFHATEKQPEIDVRAFPKHINQKTNLFLLFASIMFGKNIDNDIDFEEAKEEFPNIDSVMNDFGFVVV